MNKKIQYVGVLLGCLLPLFGCQSKGGDDPLVPPVQDELELHLADERVVETPELKNAEASAEEAEDVFEQLEIAHDFIVEADEFDPLFVELRYQLYKAKELKWTSLIKETSSAGVGFEQPERFVDCYQLVHSLAQGYHGLQSGLQQGYFSASKYDIRFLTEDCDTVFGVQSLYLPTMLGLYQLESAERGRSIVYYYHTKQDDQRVVVAVENLSVLLDGELDAEMNRIYGRALVKMGRLEDAAKALSLVVRGLDPREQWSLRLEIAELLIASGEYEEARNQYLAIAEVLGSWEETHKVVTDQLALLYATDDHTTEIALYTQCLYAFLSFDGQSIPMALEQNLHHLQRKYPEGIHADAALELYNRAEEKIRDSVSQRLLQVQRRSDDKQFQQALDELTDMKQARLPADALAQIDEMIVVVGSERETYIQLQKEKRIQALADRWQEGLNLLDMQMYDASIAIFSELLGTEYDGRAVREIQRGAGLAAVALRKEAANLFIKARRTTDYNGRITYLNQSRQLLQEILDKYPQVELAEKVAVNLAVIDEQLQAMGQPDE